MTIPQAEPEVTTATFKVWAPQGVDVIVRTPVSNPHALLTLITDYMSAGFSANPPGIINLESDEQKKTIAIAVRREKRNDDGSVSPVIDVYADRDQYRFTSIYLDTPDEITDFEAHAGVKLANMPLYESQSPLQRDLMHQHRVEVACKPFDAIRRENGEQNIGGVTRMTYRFDRYADSALLQKMAGKPPAQDRTVERPAPQVTQPAHKPATDLTVAGATAYHAGEILTVEYLTTETRNGTQWGTAYAMSDGIPFVIPLYPEHAKVIADLIGTDDRTLRQELRDGDHTTLKTGYSVSVDVILERRDDDRRRIDVKETYEVNRTPTTQQSARPALPRARKRDDVSLRPGAPGTDVPF